MSRAATCTDGPRVDIMDPRVHTNKKFVPAAGMAAWRNGNASDYESGDCRFDPCGGHFFSPPVWIGPQLYRLYPV
ncbi:hypothetical protein BD414DRAFT_503580 [Trametes punicea]|nr:hypothetical protein BD414DRAFT_503580 [Trametes punicea]